MSRFLTWLDRYGIHVHSHSKAEFPPARWPVEFEPRYVCRCGSFKLIGQAVRWYPQNGQWEYDDAIYGRP